MGKAKKTKRKNNGAEQKTAEGLEEKRGRDENSLVDADADDYLINYLLTPSEKEDEVAAGEVFVDQSDDSDKVCPKCGMPLVDRYCMGCGMNVKPVTENRTNHGSLAYSGAYVKGSGYGGGNAYVAREKALYRKPKKKKNILEENGLAGFFLIFIGVAAGFLIGIFVLKMYFAPKSAEVILYREAKVTEIAGIKTIKAGKSNPFEVPLEDLTQKDGKKTSGKGNQTTDANGMGGTNSASGQSSSTQKINRNPQNEFFYGKLTIQALGNKVVSMEEFEEWDTTGIDPNDVTYVINNLNHLYEKYQYQFFVENEITQEDKMVKVHFVFRNLDLQENRKALISLGVIDEMVTAGPEGREYISLEKLQEALDADGWSLKNPAKPKASSSPAPAMNQTK